jgi:hypothetical protein
MPPSHIFLKRKIQKKKKKEICWGGLGVAEPHPGQTGWPASPYGIFLFLKIK